METWDGDKNDDEVGGARVSAAAGGSGVEGRPTCCICMEPWTCEDAHRICCIPCGHVYGRSCLENWLSRCRNTSAKCPQCGRPFTLEHIINLYAPENLLDGCCSIQASVSIGASGSEVDLNKEVLNIFLEPANRVREHGVHIDEIIKRLKLPQKKIWEAIKCNVDVGILYNTIDEFHFKDALDSDYYYHTQAPETIGASGSEVDLNKQVLSIFLEPANRVQEHGVHIDEIIKRLKLPRKKIWLLNVMWMLGSCIIIDEYHFKDALDSDYYYHTQVLANGLNEQILGILDEPTNRARVHGGVHIDEIIKRFNLPEQKIRDAIAYNIDLGNLYTTIDDFHYKLIT